MNTNNIFFLGIFLIVLSITSCSSKPDKSQLTGSLTETAGNRGAAKKKSFKFKSLAAFEKGNANLSLEDLELLGNKDIGLVVFFDTDADWANVFNTGVYDKTGDEFLNRILSENNLTIVEQSDFDNTSDMLILEADKKLENPALAAKEISKIRGVQMVHLKDKSQSDTESAKIN